MTVIRPFRGLRYNLSRISDMKSVVAPPYDVIDPTEEEALRARDPHNVVRLTLGKSPRNGRSKSKYLEAAATLQKWTDDGILSQDNEHSIYVLEQGFRYGNEQYIRRGFISALQLEEPGSKNVFPHEHTMSSPKDDRYRLMRSCQTKLSPIITTCSDTDGTVDSLLSDICTANPLFSFDDDDGVSYRLWNITDPEKISTLREEVLDCSMVIADGHHRFESAFKFAQDNRSQDLAWGEDPLDYIPSLCISVYNRGLKIFPTHRRIRCNTLTTETISRVLSRNFNVSPAENVSADTIDQHYLQSENPESSIICALPDGELVELSPANIGTLRSRFPENADSWWKLPVALLHYVILPDILDISPEDSVNSDLIDYHHSGQEVVTSVRGGDFNAGFLLPPASPETVQRVASGGERLPQKSTYFYPKIVSGLVFYPHTADVLPQMP